MALINKPTRVAKKSAGVTDMSSPHIFRLVFKRTHNKILSVSAFGNSKLFQNFPPLKIKKTYF